MSAHFNPTIDVEQALLGAVLLHGELFNRLRDVVAADDFVDPAHAHIFGHMTAAADSGLAPGMLTIHARLGDYEIADGVPVGMYLARLCGATGAGPKLALEYARQVREMADVRRLAAIGDDLAVLAKSPGGVLSPSKAAADIVARLDPIIAASRTGAVRRVTLGQASRKAVDLAFDRMRGKPTRTMSTGLPDLDSMTGGLEPGELSLLAGRPGMGKTAAALQVAYNIAKRGMGVVIFSLEMGDGQLAYRLLSSMLFDSTPAGGAPLYYSRIARGQMTDLEAERVEKAGRKLNSVPLIIEPESGLSIAQIGSRVRHIKQQLAADGVDLGLIVVDHIGLVQASSRYSGNRVNELAEISAGLRRIGKETEAHVMALCQLNRGVESRDNKRPLLSDLRESGALEQDADLVMGAYRAAYYLKDSISPEDVAAMIEVQNKLEIGILKNRQGPVGSVHLFADMGANAIRSARDG